MSIQPEHLLKQAHRLARNEPRKPQQASLRRSLSTAYYSIFHLLVGDAVRQIGPRLSEENFNHIYRWFDHGVMRSAAKEFSQPQVKHYKNDKFIVVKANTVEIQTIAQMFVDLQDFRHDADYNPAIIFQRAEVLTNLAKLDQVFKLWKETRNTPEANAFLLSLLLWEKWGKQR